MLTLKGHQHVRVNTRFIKNTNVCTMYQMLLRPCQNRLGSTNNPLGGPKVGLLTALNTRWLNQCVGLRCKKCIYIRKTLNIDGLVFGEASSDVEQLVQKIAVGECAKKGGLRLVPKVQKSNNNNNNNN